MNTAMVATCKFVGLFMLALWVGACGGDGELPFGVCPTREADWSYDCSAVVEPGTSCDRPVSTDAGTALPESCVCEGSFWVCNSCPFYWTPAAPVESVGAFGPCTPGTTCTLNSWEHGCDCGCGADGTWSCAPQTIGSHCP